MAKKTIDKPLSYRLLTGPDDSNFCKRVSEALDAGYVLYKSPTMTYDPDKKTIIVAQAVVLKSKGK